MSAARRRPDRSEDSDTLYDFHTHTFLSDGVLAPVELIRRALKAGYRVMAITDHVGHGNLEHVLKTLIKDCQVASDRWDILALPGVEITHTPKEDIAGLAQEAKGDGRQSRQCSWRDYHRALWSRGRTWPR